MGNPHPSHVQSLHTTHTLPSSLPPTAAPISIQAPAPAPDSCPYAPFTISVLQQCFIFFPFLFFLLGGMGRPWSHKHNDGVTEQLYANANQTDTTRYKDVLKRNSRETIKTIYLQLLLIVKWVCGHMFHNISIQPTSVKERFIQTSTNFTHKIYARNCLLRTQRTQRVTVFSILKYQFKLCFIYIWSQLCSSTISQHYDRDDSVLRLQAVAWGFLTFSFFSNIIDARLCMRSPPWGPK